MDERLRVKVAGNNGTGKEAAPADSEFEKKYPLTFEFLTATAWSETEAREPGSLLIFTQGSDWKCMIKDKDSGCVAFVTKTTFKGLLEAVERGFVEEKLDWREDAFKAKKKGGSGR